MSFKELTEVKFELEQTITWGVKKDKYSGFSIPIIVDMETQETIESLVSEHKTKDPLYGNTIYLKTKGLSDRQKKERYYSTKARHLYLSTSKSLANTREPMLATSYYSKLPNSASLRTSMKTTAVQKTKQQR